MKKYFTHQVLSLLLLWPLFCRSEEAFRYPEGSLFFSQKINYRFANEPIDVVIPCHPKDLSTLPACLTAIRRYGTRIRNLFVISEMPLTEEAEWISESLFPFSKESVALEIFNQEKEQAKAFLEDPQTRIGWIFQQLLKFYAPFVIPGISSNVLMLDADVVFLKEVAFMNERHEPFFRTGREYVRAYFDHANRLLPGLRRVEIGKSGIAHHMLFQKPVLEDLFAQITKVHRTDPWKALCHCIDRKELLKSCLSEYEIYFNFFLLRSSQARLLRDPWAQVADLNQLSYYEKAGYTFVACPEWLKTLFAKPL